MKFKNYLICSVLTIVGVLCLYAGYLSFNVLKTLGNQGQRITAIEAFLNQQIQASQQTSASQASAAAKK